MKKSVFIIALIFSFGLSFSQGKSKGAKDDFEFDKKTGTVKDASGNLLFNIEYVRNVTANAVADDYYFKNKDGKLLIVFKFSDYIDPKEMNNGNPTGRISYYEIKFFTEPVMESECSYGFLKGLVKLVINKKLIENNELNLEKVKEFVVINGNAYSRRRSELRRY